MPPTKYPKPLHGAQSCEGCVLQSIGHGFVPPSGPVTAPVVILSEAPGYDEAAIGAPMIGAAGGMLTRILTRMRRTREQLRIVNSLQCVPPGFEIKKEWRGAIHHCARHRDPVLHLEPHKVIVAAGSTAIKTALGLWDYPGRIRVEDFHGTVHKLPNGQYVVPTYHPSHLQRGAHNLMGIVMFDLQTAFEVAESGWAPDPILPIVDPPVEWLRAWITESLAMLRQDPDAFWGAIDIETPDKAGGRDEGELNEADRSYTIERVNGCRHPDEGWTVPYSGPYIPLLHEYIAGLPNIMGWNWKYDGPRLLKAGARWTGKIHDGMWYAKLLQSDVPLGLGFWAPFYSKHGAWKHTSASDPGTYAAYDGPQTQRTVYGIVGDLVEAGQWDTAERHVRILVEDILKPAQLVGVQVDRVELDRFEADLTAKAKVLYARMQDIVPENQRPLTGGVNNSGFTRKPVEGAVHAKGTTLTRKGEVKAGAEDMDPLKLEMYAQHARIVERRVRRMVHVCRGCGAVDIQKRHRCADKQFTPNVQLEDREVTRWFWQEPFNPDSPPQVLAYIKARGHQPGKNKKTKKESTDRETLVKLAKSTKDPMYQALVDLRAVAKIRGTYAIGVRKRLDAHNRFHPEFTLRPSTMRTSCVAPNIQNVVADKGGKDSLAAGFRKCIIAGDQPPPWWGELTSEQQQEYL